MVFQHQRGSVLHEVLPSHQPGDGEVTRFRVYGMQLVALFTLGFPSATYLKYLTLLHTVTRWLVLQKARRHTHKVLRPVVGVRFQVLFHSPSGVLFTFPSRYFFTIGH